MAESTARSAPTPASRPPAGGSAIIAAKRGIWGRQLDRYPATGPRAAYLAIVVIATIVLYYELYVQGSVATALAASLHMTLVYLIAISIVGNGVGAFATMTILRPTSSSGEYFVAMPATIVRSSSPVNTVSFISFFDFSTRSAARTSATRRSISMN